MTDTASQLKKLLAALKNPQTGDVEIITQAYEFAETVHKDQKRLSGESYFSHCVAVAEQLAALGMDGQTIAAGLLHDAHEDGATPLSEIEKRFGKEVAFLVDGVTKLGKYKYRGVVRHAESLRKLFLAVSKDMRVLVIRLADRLHNMKTLAHVRDDKQRRIALETLEIYAPIANRLGMGRIKGDLEDYAFPYVLPKEYAWVAALRKERAKNATKRLEKVYRDLQMILRDESVEVIAADYRIKHLYSLYRKLLRYDKDIEKIYDIAALRVIVPTDTDCYRVLGIIHSLWQPLPARIKDYIATPKPNGYQSLHTSIFTGDGGIVEIQIRTQKMHEEAEYGVAAHFSYKEGLRHAEGHILGKKFRWIQELVKWQKQVAGPNEFLSNLQMDFFSDRVFVFTPKGDVIDLPEESLPLDFAYAVHSGIGDRLAGVKVNNKLVSLDTKLKNGDIVEIVTKKSSAPSAKWLSYAKTAIAKKHIKAALARNKH
ncbi:MAG: bifunctional (p)ppGpp synthetase/guanosine-3',5'-bis(diphosphate) 3'-pyrophosphohydrolase [Parcubacteria group bacterium]|nr:bifunctional (p)ppGpp synthetase/guanosine-3',5'-bis(diphosphate) 3'-pyrophosphohydrolase [Parcubacteria group bacterium]MBI3074895.1 bifunctional (p)ppGpp synthetase/guanosine-3',5'-bis(diphosphate) 3'-pyrophosphohydrolase [Parcubacteria group bacterium]